MSAYSRLRKMQSRAIVQVTPQFLISQQQPQNSKLKCKSVGISSPTKMMFPQQTRNPPVPPSLKFGLDNMDQSLQRLARAKSANIASRLFKSKAPNDLSSDFTALSQIQAQISAQIFEYTNNKQSIDPIDSFQIRNYSEFIYLNEISSSKSFVQFVLNQTKIINLLNQQIKSELNKRNQFATVLTRILQFENEISIILEGNGDQYILIQNTVNDIRENIQFIVRDQNYVQKTVDYKRQQVRKGGLNKEEIIKLCKLKFE
ncbi:Hypothetical_protein [Hexamita inflata]|uniref:Hypothetical_protein n=1 Tax=Hexamita inflata TaxID=28002 RepID=A0AA86PVV4_9EUKA|nr:Hypothetical protein HINF_LOCUS33613 [Hexamita inflata]